MNPKQLAQHLENRKKIQEAKLKLQKPLIPEDLQKFLATLAQNNSQNKQD